MIADGCVHIIGIVFAIAAAALVFKISVIAATASTLDRLDGNGSGSGSKPRDAHAYGDPFDEVLTHK